MTAQEFLLVADDLMEGMREGDWRSAISRAYYAGLHGAREFLTACGFSVPVSEQVHPYLWRRLGNCGHPDIVEVGDTMNHYRQIRNWADYDLGRPMNQKRAIDFVQNVDELLKRLATLPSLPEAREGIIDTIKVYERDVLREQTWKQ